MDLCFQFLRRYPYVLLQIFTSSKIDMRKYFDWRGSDSDSEHWLGSDSEGGS